MSNPIEKFLYLFSARGPSANYGEVAKEKENWIATLMEADAIEILNWVESPYHLPITSMFSEMAFQIAKEDAIEVAAKVGLEKGSKDIREKIEHLFKYPELQYGVLQGIQILRNNKSIPFLIKNTDNPNEEIIAEIVLALIEIDGDDAKIALEKIVHSVKNPQPYLSSCLEEGLNKFK